jgi:hypothetical protein
MFHLIGMFRRKSGYPKKAYTFASGRINIL